MPLDPQKSREAHSQSGSRSSTAATPKPQPRDSLARGNCDLRGPQGATSRRRVVAPQPFPVAPGSGVVGHPLRSSPRYQVPRLRLSRIALATADDEMMAAERDDHPDPFEMLRQRIREDARRSARFRRFWGTILPTVAIIWAALWFLFKFVEPAL